MLPPQALACSPQVGVGSVWFALGAHVPWLLGAGLIKSTFPTLFAVASLHCEEVPDQTGLPPTKQPATESLTSTTDAAPVHAMPAAGSQLHEHAALPGVKPTKASFSFVGYSEGHAGGAAAPL